MAINNSGGIGEKKNIECSREERPFGSAKPLEHFVLWSIEYQFSDIGRQGNGRHWKRKVKKKQNSCRLHCQ
jgi:hypothetical protein